MEGGDEVMEIELFEQYDAFFKSEWIGRVEVPVVGGDTRFDSRSRAKWTAIEELIEVRQSLTFVAPGSNIKMLSTVLLDFETDATNQAFERAHGHSRYGLGDYGLGDTVSVWYVGRVGRHPELEEEEK